MCKINTFYWFNKEYLLELIGVDWYELHKFDLMQLPWSPMAFFTHYRNNSPRGRQIVWNSLKS